jgi:dephospho-CoA kinase
VLRVGLTGGIGAGKSEVSRRLAAAGAVVIDSDLLAREVVASGSDGYDEVVEAFGPEVLGADGELNRQALGRRVFGDEGARRRLEAIVHPRVRARAKQIEASCDPDAVVVHDIPLLTETGQAGKFDIVVVVDAPDDVQVERLTRTRGLAEPDARARMAAQASREQRRAVADEVVDNSADLGHLHEQVDALWQRLKAAADRASSG